MLQSFRFLILGLSLHLGSVHLGSAYAEVASDGIPTRTSSLLQKYGETLLIQAEYETKPFAFFHLFSNQKPDQNPLYSFHTLNNIPFIIASSDQHINRGFLYSDLALRLFHNDEYTKLFPPRHFPTNTHTALHTLEALDDIIADRISYEELMETLDLPVDDQHALDRFAADMLDSAYFANQGVLAG